MTETQLRFLRSIAERLPLERVVELHLFPPMRQGALETGIAVIAAERELPPLEMSDEATGETAADAPDAPSGEAAGEASGTPSVDASVDALGEACDPTEDASREAADDAIEPSTAGATADAMVESTAEPTAEASDAESDPASRAPSPASRPSRSGFPRAATPNRHTVFTARYRLTLKGPERGRWELSVVEEADAPLLTIEMVVRGVQRRTADGAADPERIDPAALRDLLAAPAA